MRRRNQVTCRCFAYDFPHRFGGGKCDGYSIVREKFGGVQCQQCNLLNNGCEVLKGIEPASECAYVIEFCEYNEINIK